MANTVILKWLNGNRNYHVGVSLYNAFGTNNALKLLLAKGKSAASEKLLGEELAAIVHRETATVKKNDDRTASQAFPREGEREGGQMPVVGEPILDALQHEWKPLYAEMNYLRHQLDSYQGNTPDMIAARKPIAFKVLELEEQCNAIWYRRDHYLTLGLLPEVKAKDVEIPTEPLELAKFLTNLTRNIRRLKQAADKPGADAKYTAMLQRDLATYKTATGKDYGTKKD